MIIDQAAELKYLIEPLKLDDPRLHQALDRMIDQVSAVTQEVSPIEAPIIVPTPPPQVVGPPISPKAEIQPMAIRLSWGWVSGASEYEVRLMTPAQFDNLDWDAAQFVIRTTLTLVDILPFRGPVGYYAFKSINSDGVPSDTCSTVAVFVNKPSQVHVTGSVIDNNVLLNWVKIEEWTPGAGNFAIDKYIVYRGGAPIGETRASFVSSFESAGGIFIYSVAGVDIAGNVGLPASIELTVSSPPDYILEDRKVSDLSGEKVNVVLYEGNKLLGPTIIPAQTWEQHFASRTWLDPEDQVTAGYPYYIQPGAPELGGVYGDARGYYKELIDYGSIVEDVILTVQYNFRNIDPANPIDLKVDMTWSDDAITWADAVSGATQYIKSLRYLYFAIYFRGNDKAIAEVFNILIMMSVKRDVDGGSVSVSKDDVGGTIVYFNKTFKDIESITLTPKSLIEPFTAIYDFQDVPDPTFFKIFAFDTTGVRIDAVVDWKARGIVL